MKNKILFFAFLVTFVAGILVGRFVIPPSSVRESSWVRVLRVVDGDTIKIEGGQTVRYIGVDTPETKHPRKGVECYGLEASKKNKELVEGKMVLLEKEGRDQDKFGRLLRHVWVNNTHVNAKLLEEGYARIPYYSRRGKYHLVFEKAEGAAQKHKRGLWGACSAAPSKKG